MGRRDEPSHKEVMGRSMDNAMQLFCFQLRELHLPSPGMYRALLNQAREQLGQGRRSLEPRNWFAAKRWPG